MSTGTLLTTRNVAKILGKSLRTVHRLADSGELPYSQKLDGETGAYLFDPAVVEYYRRQREREQAKATA